MVSTGKAVLLITADETFGRAVEKRLSEYACPTLIATNLIHGMALAEQVSPVIILVDRRQLGIQQLRRHRALHHIPLITLQPPGVPCSEEECVEELEEGTADLVLCPQSLRELVARVRAVLRSERLRAAPRSRYVVGSLQVDVDRYEVTVEGRPVELTPKEFRILQELVQAPSRVFTRDELLNRVWGEGTALEAHTLDVHIHSLRQKIEPDPAHPQFIVTVRGVGYKLKPG